MDERPYNCFGAHLLETKRNVVQVVFEQICVGVQGHGGGGMPEHSLNGFHIRARGDREACRSVPEVMGTDLGEAGIDVLSACDRSHEPSRETVGCLQVLDSISEQDAVSLATLAELLDRLVEELWIGTL